MSAPTTINAPGGGLVKIPDTPENALIAADARAAASPIPSVASLVDGAGTTITIACRVCGHEFTSETTVIGGKAIPFTICDTCAAAERMNQPAVTVRTREQRRQAWWTSMVGPRYEKLQPELLPFCIRRLEREVMTWKVSARGIGLVGASRTGKSPLIYGLGRRLYIDGINVFPTSGMSFQRAYQLSFANDEGRVSWVHYMQQCIDCEVLLIDDADKINFTSGVEAELYHMLDTRRNWLRPILCTLNLTGPEMEALAKDRADRVAAIVERLRDLCEFMEVKP